MLEYILCEKGGSKMIIFDGFPVKIRAAHSFLTFESIMAGLTKGSR